MERTPVAIADGGGQPVNAPSASGIEARALEISNLLQSSLELDQVLGLFSEELRANVAHDGLRYRNRAEGVDVLLGSDEGHSCSYQIDVVGDSLGELTLYRQAKPFGEQELTQVESLLCALLYPLRNALLYRRALRNALRDPLTGVSNRAALDGALQREVEVARRYGQPLSLVMLDVDHFKRVNDRHGHLAGDAVLQALAQCLLDCARGSDAVFRYGGEEFAIVLSNTAEDGALRFAERVRRAVAALDVRRDDEPLPVTVSLGVATLRDGDSAHDLVARADRALYLAKAQGRNRVARCPD